MPRAGRPVCERHGTTLAHRKGTDIYWCWLCIEARQRQGGGRRAAALYDARYPFGQRHIGPEGAQ